MRCSFYPWHLNPESFKLESLAIDLSLKLLLFLCNIWDVIGPGPGSNTLDILLLNIINNLHAIPGVNTSEHA